MTEPVPPFLLWLVFVMGAIAAATMLLKWAVRTILASIAEWRRRNNGNGHGHTGKPPAMPIIGEALDVQQLRRGLRNLQHSADKHQALMEEQKVRDQERNTLFVKFLDLQREILKEIRGLRKETHRLDKDLLHAVGADKEDDEPGR